MEIDTTIIQYKKRKMNNSSDLMMNTWTLVRINIIMYKMDTKVKEIRTPTRSIQ